MATDEASVEAALREERELVLTLGGFALEQAGGVLVLNERIPVPRFNFVQNIRVHRNRQSTFLERALDHYFQRALRPTIRVERPVPDFLAESLRRLGFRPAAPITLLVRRTASELPPPDPRFEVRAATEDEIPAVAGFWAGPAEREELVRALEVAVHHPNPDETVVPGIALRDGSPVSAALLHSDRGFVGVHAVVTRSTYRGQGAATALVSGLLRPPFLPETETPVAMWSENPRLGRHLAPLGFEVRREYSVYELGPGAELSVPAPAPPAPPRWRPPRGPSSAKR